MSTFTMETPVNHTTWRMCRFILRGKGKPVPGAQLRLTMSRWSKTGEFLDALVELGIFHRTGQMQEPKGKPQQFRVCYTLTEIGKQVAEYGMFTSTSEQRKIMQRYHL